jgi:hypothetical protein
MNLFRKSVLSFVGVAAAALLLALTSPRTMHALGPLGAELVRITNTAEAPAVVEEVPHLASHLVTLTASANQTLQEMGPDGTVKTDDFVVPAGQSLVITGVEFTIYTNNSADVILMSTTESSYGNWIAPAAATTQFQYPSGIVVASGTNLEVLATNPIFVIIHGYLTPN